jgi:hypothetical protein
MSSILGRLAVALSLDTAAFEAGLNKASKEANRQAKEIGKGFNEVGETFESLLGPLGEFGGQFTAMLGSVGAQISSVVREIGPLGASIGTVGAAAVGAGAAVTVFGAAAIALAISGAETVEQIEHLSEKTGIAKADLVSWGAVAEASGSNLETFQVGVRRLEVAMAGITPAGKVAREVLQSIGVTAKDPQEALLEVADAFQKMPDGAQKAAVAVAIFGRSGTDMIPILDQGRQAILKWQAAGEQIGAVIDQNVKAAQAWKEKSVELGLAWENNKVSFVGLLGALAEIDNKFTSLLSKAAAFNEAIQGNVEELPVNNQKNIDAERTRLETDNQSQMLELAQKALDLAKAHTNAGAALLELQEKIKASEEDTSAAGKLQTAQLLSQVESAKQLAAYAEATRKEAEREAQAYADVMTRIESIANAWKPGQAYTGPQFTREMYRGQEEARKPLEAPPDIGAVAAQLVPKTQDVLSVAAVMQQFNDTFSTGVQKDIEHLQEMSSEFEKLRAVGAITNEQFSAGMAKINDALEKANYDLAAQQGSVTFAQAWNRAFTDIAQQGANFARGLSAEIESTMNNVNKAIAQTIVTGKSLNLSKIFQGTAESLLQGGLQKGESALFGALGFGGGKHDGSSASAPLYTQDVSLASLGGGAGGTTSIFDSFFSNLTSGFANMFSQLKNTFSSLFSGLSGGFSFTGLGGFFADGGVTAPGMSYMVGEQGPEIFSPGVAGTVTPIRGGGPTVVNNYDFRGADAGAEQRIRMALRDTEDRAVVRSIATVSEMNKRRTT